jgi:hypothetical protein
MQPRRLRGLLVVAIIAVIGSARAAAVYADQCGQSCSSARRVCALQVKTAQSACVTACRANATPRQCLAACRTASRNARNACNAAHADCGTSCAAPATSADGCAPGCASAGQSCFASVLTSGRPCVQTCAGGSPSERAVCLQGCATALESDGAACLATLQGCLAGCQGPTTGVCFDTMTSQCTAQACTADQPCSSPNQICVPQCPSIPTPVPAPCSSDSSGACSGSCAIAPPCPAGTVCSNLVMKGECQADASGACQCVPIQLPTPTPQCSSVPCGGSCTSSLCPPGAPCAAPLFLGQCELTATDGCQCVPVQPPTPTPLPPQCSSVPCGGACAIPAPCTQGMACPDLLLKGECQTDTSGACQCVPIQLPTPTPQCSSVPCGGSCTSSSCPPGVMCAAPVLLGQCELTATDDCQCVPVQPPTPTPLPPQCSSVPCGGACAIPAPCTQGMACPDLLLKGECQADTSGACQCVPVQPPTPTPQCNDVPCGGICIISECPPGVLCPGSPVAVGECQVSPTGSCDCVLPSPVPTPTPSPQCAALPCGGACVISPSCPSNGPCPDFRILGQCALDTVGGCQCTPLQLPTPPPPPTPQCSSVPCGGACVLPVPPFPCPAGAMCAGLGQCEPSAAGSCDCIPVSGATPTPTPTAIASECDNAACGGLCAIRFCPPNTPCPNLLGHCELTAAGCDCVPGGGNPTPTPTPCAQCLPHGHTCCECPNQALACSDFAWIEVERACPVGCQMIMDAECESPCGPGPQGGPTSCVPLTPCTSDQDCDDGNGCTADSCTIDGCTHQCVCL